MWPRAGVLLIPAALGCLVASGCRQLPGEERRSAPIPVVAAGPDWERLPAPIDMALDEPLNVGFLIVDGVYNSELVAPMDIFHHTVFHAEAGMRVFTVSESGAPVTTFEGLEIGAHYSFDTAPSIDVLVVPSAEHSMDTDLENERLIGWVREVGDSAHFVVSLCDGAFVLAQAGLLDGFVSTTFPGDVERYEQTFPHLDVRREVSFVHDAKALTSQGGARSYDVALYLVDHLYGEKAAKAVAAGLVIPWPPAPGTMPAIVVTPADVHE